MNKDVKQRLTEALMSQEFQQTKSSLLDETGYCCLGVLTHLYLEHLNPELIKLSDRDYDALMQNYSEDRFCQMPIKEVMDWAELRDCQCIDLAAMNDSGDSFETIAEHIKRNY